MERFNCVRDTPYKSYCDIKPTINTLSGNTYALSPFGFNLEQPMKTNNDNNLLFKSQPLQTQHQLLPSKVYRPPPTLDPRPAVRIGYFWR